MPPSGRIHHLPIFLHSLFEVIKDSQAEEKLNIFINNII